MRPIRLGKSGLRGNQSSHHALRQRLHRRVVISGNGGKGAQLRSRLVAVSVIQQPPTASRCPTIRCEGGYYFTPASGI